MENTLTAEISLSKSLFETLMVQGITESRRGNHRLAFKYFQEALQLDKTNQKALMWCAMLCTDPFDAKNFLQQLLEQNPEDKLIRNYYGLAIQRCNELDQLLNESQLLQRWSKNSGGIAEFSRLGDHLVKVGEITQQQLKVALHFQEYLRKQGQNEKIGEILESFGYINKQQLQKALELQKIDFFSRFSD